jgi:hypothetical protein
MLTVYNGQRNPASGWYVDRHGHRLYLRAGDLAPICPRQGPALVMWRLTREVVAAAPPETT